MSSLSHVHVEVAIKEFAAARRQIEALAQHASGPNLASGLSRERVEGRLGLDLCRLVSRHMGLRLVSCRRSARLERETPITSATVFIGNRPSAATAAAAVVFLTLWRVRAPL